MTLTLLLAAHGTRSAAGLATTRALADAVAAVRPRVPVALCFLDVASPSLPDALDGLDGTDAVVVPVLLSAGYHVTTDIPAVVAGRSQVRVARHLGPDPVIVGAVAERLAAVLGDGEAATVALAAIASSRDSAQAEIATAADLLARRLDRPVELLPLGPGLDERVRALQQPVAVAAYLLAEGGFLDAVRDAGVAVVAEPLGTHPALVGLIWSRYDEALDTNR